jgi:hypothetical protein
MRHQSERAIRVAVAMASGNRMEALDSFIRIASLPRDGIYYLYPKRAGGWDISYWIHDSAPFGDDQDADASRFNRLQHPGVLGDLADDIAAEWGLDPQKIRHVVLGLGISLLPRGRFYRGIWGKGLKEAETVPGAESLVRQAFNFRGPIRQVLDEHWDPNPSAMDSLMSSIGGASSAIGTDPFGEVRWLVDPESVSDKLRRYVKEQVDSGETQPGVYQGDIPQGMKITPDGAVYWHKWVDPDSIRLLNEPHPENVQKRIEAIRERRWPGDRGLPVVVDWEARHGEDSVKAHSVLRMPVPVWIYVAILPVREGSRRSAGFRLVLA